LKLVILLLTTIPVFLPACADSLRERNAPLEANQLIRQVDVFELPVDITSETKLQLTVDDGHQPWRIEVASAACAEINGLLSHSNVETHLELWDCAKSATTEEEATRAIVTIQKDKVQYRVYLERLVRMDGIWTVKKIEVANPPQ
jgi:hypothetical protein